jgi:hypothetical protein
MINNGVQLLIIDGNDVSILDRTGNIDCVIMLPRPQVVKELHLVILKFIHYATGRLMLILGSWVHLTLSGGSQ